MRMGRATMSARWRIALIRMSAVLLLGALGGSWYFFSSHRGASQQPGNHFQLFTFATNVEIGGIATGPDGNIWLIEIGPESPQLSSGG